MEPVLFIAALTALHLAVLALIDVLSGTRPWPGKLGWVLVILLLPLVGAGIYYLRAGKGPQRSRPRQEATASIKPAGTVRQDEHDLAVRQGSDDE